MQAHVLVGPIPTTKIYGSDSFSSIFTCHLKYRRPLVVAAASSSAINGEPDHYKVLGIARNATSADVKRAYRLLARKYHPDVSKHLKAEELFKSIRRAYDVLSNEATRAQYDRILRFQDTGRSYRRSQFYSPDFEERERIIYRWAELRRKMRYSEQNDMNRESTSSYRDSDDPDKEESIDDDRGPFTAVLRSAFISLFLLQTFGSRLSLTFSSVMALFDQKLDAGYKIGYLIAWILGGRGGVLLTLCLQFASWVCGKTSSSVVALVVVAFWVGSSLARYAPLPQGALLTLLYMSMKLQLDLN